MARKAAPKKAKSVTKKAARTQTGGSADAWNALSQAFSSHSKRNELVRVGKQKDQLLRSLIPLYVARGLDIEVTSGLISRFWGEHGVRYAAPNAAKALRQHGGYSRVGKNGRQITQSGVQYVESALRKKAAA